MGRRVHVDLSVRRFCCRDAKCARHTFAERLQQLVALHVRRTARLVQAQGRAGAALGGEADARLLRRLVMPASLDTVLRLIRGLPLPMLEPPRVVGVDDWAQRKGRTYGTIVVDLERRRVIDRLPDRWHLLSSMRDMLERWLARAHAQLRCLPVLPGGDERHAGQRTQAFSPQQHRGCCWH